MKSLDTILDHPIFGVYIYTKSTESIASVNDNLVLLTGYNHADWKDNLLEEKIDATCKANLLSLGSFTNKEISIITDVIFLKKNRERVLLRINEIVLEKANDLPEKILGFVCESSNSLSDKENIIREDLIKKEIRKEKNKKKLQVELNTLQKLHHELKKSEIRWSYALEGNGDGVWDWDLVKNKIFFSKKSYALIGHHDFSGSRSFECLYKIIHSDFIKDFKVQMDIGRREPYEAIFSELKIRNADGSYRWIMFRGKVVELLKSGKPKRMVGTITDLSVIKYMQKELIIYEEMIKQNQSAIIFTDLNGTIEFVNNAAQQLFEYNESEIIQHPIGMLMGSVTNQNVFEELSLHSSKAVELTMYTKSDREVITQCVASVLKEDGREAIGFVINLTDITKKKKLENDLFKLSMEKLQNELDHQKKQTEMIITIQENEKEKLARELHDGVGQMLSLAKLQLQQVDSCVATDCKRDCSQILDLIQHVNVDIKNITNDLMPLSLRNLGLESAIYSLLEKYQSVTNNQLGIESRIDLKGYKPCEKTDINLYRIAQEFINNSMKYSEAKNLSLILLKLKNSIHLMIEDDGKGFNYEEAVYKENSYGLKTIKERAKMINGKLIFSSSPGNGTILSLNVSIN